MCMLKNKVGFPPVRLALEGERRVSQEARADGLMRRLQGSGTGVLRGRG